MGETVLLSSNVGRLHRPVEEQVKDFTKVGNAQDESQEAAKRRASETGQSVRSSKRKGKQAEEEVVTRELMGTDVVDAVSLELGSLKLNNDCYKNSRSSGIVLNAVLQVLQEFVSNMNRSLVRGDNAASASSSLREPLKVVFGTSALFSHCTEHWCLLNDKGDKDGTVMDLKSAAKQGYTSTALSQKDTALLAELTPVIQRGGNLKQVKANCLKAYLRHYGLRISDRKEVLVKRVEQHLKIKAGEGEEIYPRLSFNINCQGDACRGDIVLFLQTVYAAIGRPLGERWVAGKVVHESYGAKEQQHTFTIEVLWSTGTEPCHFMRQLKIKGRNLYRLYTWRQPWINEEDRVPVLAKKHEDGKVARTYRNARNKLEPKRSKWPIILNMLQKLVRLDDIIT